MGINCHVSRGQTCISPWMAGHGVVMPRSCGSGGGFEIVQNGAVQFEGEKWSDEQ